MKIAFNKKFVSSACAAAVLTGVFAPSAQAVSTQESLFGNGINDIISGGSSFDNTGGNSNASTGTNVEQVRSQIVKETNNFRVENSTDPVVIETFQNPQIQQGAQSWADNMARTGVIKHDPHLHDEDLSLSENIHVTNSPVLVAKDVVDSWASSPGHRKNMLVDTNQMGVGISHGNNGNWYVVARYKYDYNTNNNFLRNDLK